LKSIKIFGERNTGTNYLKELIRRNFDIEIIEGVPTLNYMRLNKALFFLPKQKMIDYYFSSYRPASLGWKHAVPNTQSIYEDIRFNKDELGLIFLAKNPYAWLLSMYKRPHHYDGDVSKLSFYEFLSEPWPTLGRDNVRVPLTSIIDAYNVKYRSYIEFVNASKSCLLLRYEDLILNTQDVINTISSELSLSVSDTFRNVDKSMKRDKDKNFDFYQDFYGKERWRDKLDAKSLTIINRSLDSQVVKDLGYQMLHNL
jgi:hypothetical protein